MFILKTIDIIEELIFCDKLNEEVIMLIFNSELFISSSMSFALFVLMEKVSSDCKVKNTV